MATLNKALRQGDKAVRVFDRVIVELEKAETQLFTAELNASEAARDAAVKAEIAREARARHSATLRKVRELVGSE